jgi:hypothetical protein
MRILKLILVPFGYVTSLMVSLISNRGEALIAIVTFEGFLSRVCANMHGQVGFLTKNPFTALKRAGIWQVPIMYSLGMVL